MTQLALKVIKCPKCAEDNNIIYYASINTFMDIDGSKIKALLNGSLNSHKCKNCGVLIRLSMEVLINCPNEMFYLNPADDFEYKKLQLRNYGLMTEEGVILSGMETLILKAKENSKFKTIYKPFPLPPTAPKVTPNTKRFAKISEEISKKFLKNKKNEKEKRSVTKAKPPPPPPKTPEN